MKSLLTLTAIAMTVLPLWAQVTPKERLDKSPRHLEWIKVKNGDREVSSFIAFPEVKEKATAVIVIHEIFGLTDWVRGVTDQLAEAGYIAIAPDFLTGTPGAGGGDAARTAIRALPAEQIAADLEAAIKHAASLPACNGKVVVAGFCWGGRQAFNFATNSQIKGAFVFYGDAVSTAAMPNIKAPVYGFYGENDARITSAVPKAAEDMKAAGKTFEPVTYEGAGHGFMRSGEAADANAANKKAREDAWKRWKELLGRI
ncbi:MAG TPA: dienelactone hydrolase family protein [Verrucomicrobiae bacterium]|nr:dienelactone hydrolase family protein [Verrucomicrobiae bacterium]